jgi:hypothetical protein
MVCIPMTILGCHRWIKLNKKGFFICLCCKYFCITILKHKFLKENLRKERKNENSKKSNTTTSTFHLNEQPKNFNNVRSLRITNRAIQFVPSKWYR